MSHSRQLLESLCFGKSARLYKTACQSERQLATGANSFLLIANTLLSLHDTGKREDLSLSSRHPPTFRDCNLVSNIRQLKVERWFFKQRYEGKRTGNFVVDSVNLKSVHWAS